METMFLSLPLPRTQMPLKDRADRCGCAAGETSTHDMSYSGIPPMSWASMNLVSDTDKSKILGNNAGNLKPRPGVFDTAFGMPLFWAERKPADFFGSLFKLLDAGMIIDCTPGSGTAATAALEAGIPYFGFAKNEHHANFLCNVVDRHSLRMMKTAGTPLFHQEMSECILAHFSKNLADLDALQKARDTELADEVPFEELCPAEQ